MAQECVVGRADTKLVGLLAAEYPQGGEVTRVWHAKEAVQDLYGHCDADLALP